MYIDRFLEPSKDFMSLQRSVQQQNKLSFEALLASAKHFRAHGTPIGVRRFFAAQGIDIDKSGIIRASSESDMLGFHFGFEGMLVTADEKFFLFELELNCALTEVIATHEFTDVTREQNMSEKNKGIGKGQGAMAVAVLKALNAAGT